MSSLCVAYRVSTHLNHVTILLTIKPHPIHIPFSRILYKARKTRQNGFQTFECTSTALQKALYPTRNTITTRIYCVEAAVPPRTTMNIMSPTKLASIENWAAAIASLRLHHLNVNAHGEALEPWHPVWDEHQDKKEEKVKRASRRVNAGIYEDVSIGDGEKEGNVIDWTDFYPNRTVPYAAWEFPDEREEGYFTEMSGLSDVYISTTTGSDDISNSAVSTDSDSDDDDDNNNPSTDTPNSTASNANSSSTTSSKMPSLIEQSWPTTCLSPSPSRYTDDASWVMSCSGKDQERMASFSRNTEWARKWFAYVRWSDEMRLRNEQNGEEGRG